MMMEIHAIAILTSILLTAACAADPYRDAMTAGKARERAGDWAQAAQIYLTAVKSAQNDSQKANALLSAIGDLLYHEKDYKAAIQNCRALLKLPKATEAKKAQAQFRLGVALTRDRQFIAGIAELKKLSDMKSASESLRIEAELSIAQSFYELNSYKEALAAYQKVQAHKTLNPWQQFRILLNSGRCLYEQRKYEEAAAMFEKAARLDKITPENQSWAQGKMAEVAAVFRRDKDFNKAIGVYQKLLAMDSLGPDRRAAYYVMIGKCEYGLENYREAITAFTSGLNTPKAALPYRINAQIRIGDTWRRQERYTEAIAAYENALQLIEDKESEQTAEIHLKLGICNFDKKRYSRAKKELIEVMHVENATKSQQELAQKYIKRIRRR